MNSQQNQTSTSESNQVSSSKSSNSGSSSSGSSDDVYTRPDGGGDVVIHHLSNGEKSWSDENGYHKVSGDFDPGIVYGED